MKNSRTLLFCLLAMLVISLVTTGTMNSQQTAGQLFEKALYAEDIKGDLSEAVRIYQQILEEEPGNRQITARALLHIGMCFEKLGSTQARRAYSDLISKYSDQATEVALARERISRLEAYEAELMAKAEEHLMKGNELFKKWEYEEAIKEYENAVNCGPNSQLALNARYCIGQSWYRAGKYDEALAIFTKLIEENPNSTIAPVSELMVAQVRHAIGNDKSPAIVNNYPDEDIIVDPETDITYRKIRTFTGKYDVIKRATGTSISPNGKFLLKNNKIVPLDGGDPFDFIHMQVNSAWSPDGKKVAFICGDSSIYMVTVSPETGHAIGTPEILLKREKDCALYEVNWSPDSKKLFFEMTNSKEKEYPEIFSLSILDREIKPLTTANFPQFCPTCSPDGNTIAFVGPYADLWLCPAEGGPAKELIGNKHTKPHWTPDGKWVFSDETRKGWGRSLNFVRIFDKKTLRLTPPEKTGTFVSLSHEGKRILFLRSSHNFMWGMKVTSASGGPSYEPVAHLPVYGAQWSANSKMIIVQGEKNNKLEEGDAAMRIVPLAGGESFLLDMDVDVHGKPFAYCVTPDQKRILFVIKKDGDETDDLYMAPISISESRVTGAPTRIIENWNRGGAYNTKLSMSHDGTRLAIIDDEDIWIYDMNKEKLKQITNTSQKKKWVAWTPDDQMLSYWAFVDNPEFGVESRIISSDEGTPIKTLSNCMIYPKNWCVDSKSVAMREDDKFIIRNIFSDEIRVILDLNTLGLDDISDYCWSPDGKYLAIDGIVESEPDIQYHLLNISVDDGKITELASDDTGWKYDMTWSPDGKWICYCYMDMDKVRPESTLWEADFDEILEKLAK